MCEKASRGTVVYSVVMVHAWLDYVPVAMFQNLYGEYLCNENATKFDSGWDIHDFVVVSVGRCVCARARVVVVAGRHAIISDVNVELLRRSMHSCATNIVHAVE